ncbi:MAG: ROK family protein [Clostridia bacterium]|nr:ROK family protein [Clostridia bacterium]
MRIGVDVGGSHIGLGLVNKDGKLVLKAEKDYDKIQEDMSNIVLETIIELINKIIDNNDVKKEEIESIGIAFPGTVSETTVIKAENLGIDDFEVVKKLKKHFDVPIHLENDAKCAAIAEKEFGSLKNYEDAIFLIIGTGVGGAVYLNGKLLRPKRYSGFEVGHTVINKDGIKCSCGRRGCFEVYSSMRRLKEKISKEFNLNTIDGIKIREFIEKNKDNKKLNEILDEYTQNLEIGIANLINIFEPQAISIGGSFGHYDMLLKRLQDKINEKTELYNKEQIPKIVIAELKNDAGMIGAAMI